MLDIEVNPRLRRIHSNFDCIVDSPRKDFCLGLYTAQLCRTYRFIGTKMFNNRADVGLILAGSGRRTEQAVLLMAGNEMPKLPDAWRPDLRWCQLMVLAKL